MADHSSTRVVYAALIGNGLIAITKFGAAAHTGSSAMLSEAIHSVVDTGNQLLMLLGMRNARKPADEMHPFGYGRELYFWAFVVAILIFGLGAGISAYEGVIKVRAPHPVTNPVVNYVVLAVAMVFEAGAWYVAYKEFKKTKGAMGYIEAVRRSKDPTVFTILFEDTAAMLGLIAALVGLALAEALDLPVLDGVASIVIGAILAATAALLAWECKGLLIGERAGLPVIDGIRRIVAEEPGILALNEILTMHMGPEDVLLNVSLDFADDVTSPQVEASISLLERRIKAEFPEITRVFIEAQNLVAHRRAQAEAAARARAAAGKGEEG